METRYLVDTCAIIKYLQETFHENGLVFLDSILDEESQISFITQIELLAWKTPHDNNLSVLKQFIKGSKILYIYNTHHNGVFIRAGSESLYVCSA